VNGHTLKDDENDDDDGLLASKEEPSSMELILFRTVAPYTNTLFGKLMIID
jgi:hypothetical protein